jgi:hypothetical protein
MMFKLIQRVIARITQAMGGATSTQPAGHAPQGRTTRTGKAPIVSAATKPQPQPASKKPKRKPSLVQAGTTAQSRKPKQKPAQQTFGENGLQAQTPASQPASKSPTRKSKTAQPTTVAKLRKPASKPAQTTSGKRGRPRKIAV